MDYEIFILTFTIEDYVHILRTSPERQQARKSCKLTDADNELDEEKPYDNDEPSAPEALFTLAQHMFFFFEVSFEYFNLLKTFSIIISSIFQQ